MHTHALTHTHTSKKWPADHSVHVWMPSEAWSTESADGGQPPSRESDKEGHSVGYHGNGDGDHVTKSSNQMMSTNVQSHYASCTQQHESAAAEKITSLADNVQGHPHWAHRAFDVIGFGLSLSPSHPNHRHPLCLSLWHSNISKSSFIKYG